ncbi:hypothetical protein SO694_00066165 [Aureococcus anophagefferens]|uniref:Uncharacterized protein n=1 Tax=Aureococcus anophagefferens TaxID=44056 RepID=A0ABR1FQA9_AURAN
MPPKRKSSSAEATATRAVRRRLAKHLRRRASNLAISTALDIQLPLLAAYLELDGSAALAATSKERIDALAKAPVLAALAKQMPVLDEPGVRERVDDAEWPGVEVMRFVADETQDVGTQWLEDAPRCVVELRLAHGARVLSRGRLRDLGCSDEGELAARLDFGDAEPPSDDEDDASAPGADTTVVGGDPEPVVLEALRDYGDDGSFVGDGGFDSDAGHEEFGRFLSDTNDVGVARVSLVRHDGSFLTIFRGKVCMVPDVHYWENDDYDFDRPWEIPLHEFKQDDERILSNAAILTTDCLKEDDDANVYRARGIELRFRWAQDTSDFMPFAYNDPWRTKQIHALDNFYALLEFAGAWR